MSLTTRRLAAEPALHDAVNRIQLPFLPVTIRIIYGAVWRSFRWDRVNGRIAIGFLVAVPVSIQFIFQFLLFYLR